MQYVYRYVQPNGDAAYFGITNDMDRRVTQHKSDKLKDLNAIIQFFPVKHRADAELIETYLICRHDTCKDYNVLKTGKGKVSFLDGVRFPWVDYPCRKSEMPEPFVVKPQVIEKEKKVYVQSRFNEKSLSQMLAKKEQEVLEWRNYLEHELKVEEEIRKGIFEEDHSLQVQSYGYISGKIDDPMIDGFTLSERCQICTIGMILHHKRESALQRLLNKTYESVVNVSGVEASARKPFSELLLDATSATKEVDEFENLLKAKCTEYGFRALKERLKHERDKIEETFNRELQGDKQA